MELSAYQLIKLEVLYITSLRVNVYYYYIIESERGRTEPCGTPQTEGIETDLSRTLEEVTQV